MLEQYIIVVSVENSKNALLLGEPDECLGEKQGDLNLEPRSTREQLGNGDVHCASLTKKRAPVSVYFQVFVGC